MGEQHKKDLAEYSSNAEKDVMIKTHGKDAKIANLIADKSFEPKTIDRKSVFKPILTSPFTINWPTINNSDANAIFHTLLSILNADPIQRLLQRQTSLPRKSAANSKQKNERRKARFLLTTLLQNGIVPSLSNKKRKAEEEKEKEQSLAILCGINSVTRMLEQEIANIVHQESEHIHSDVENHRPSIIFVCNADVSPSSLTSHFPLLIASYNAFCSKSTILIPLPFESQTILSDAVNLRRCGVLSLDFDAMRLIGDETLNTKLTDMEQKLAQAKIHPIRMAWMDEIVSSIRQNSDAKINLTPPHIKHLSSSAPNDVNAFKEAKRVKRKSRISN